MMSLCSVGSYECREVVVELSVKSVVCWTSAISCLSVSTYLMFISCQWISGISGSSSRFHLQIFSGVILILTKIEMVTCAKVALLDKINCGHSSSESIEPGFGWDGL